MGAQICIMHVSIDFIIMKFPIISTIAVSLCAMVSTVQAELKVAAINQAEVIMSFHKTFAMQDRLQRQQESVVADLRARQERLQQLQSEDDAIRAQFDPSLTEAARRRLQEEHNAKVNEIQAYEQEYRTYVQRREAALREMQSHEFAAVLKEVQDNVETIATEKGIDLLVDSSAVSMAGTRVFPYVKPTLDITPEVISTLNRTAPAGFDLEAEKQRRSNPANR